MSLLAACTTVTSSGASTSGHPAPPAADGPASPAGTVSGATVPAATTTGSALPPRAGCAGLTPTAYGYNVALQGATESPLVAIEFVSARQGWAVGYGHILATTDGGRAWTTQYSGPARLDQVDFTDAGHGWAVGEDTLLATSNGGQTWTPVTDPCHAIRSVHFVTPDLGYAVFGGGQTDSTMVRLDGGVPAAPGGGTLLRTSDGGRTWLAVPGSPADVQTVCFSDPDGGFLATPGRVWHTTDGGLAWAVSLTEAKSGASNPQRPPDTAVLECAGPSAAYASFLGPGSVMNQEAALAYATRDGRTWQVLFQDTGQGGTYPGVAAPAGPGLQPGPYSAISPDSAIFVGWNPVLGLGQAPMAIVTGTAITSLGDVGGLTRPFGAAFISPRQGWVIGEDQVTAGNGNWGEAVIQATTDGGHTWTRQYQVPWPRISS